MNFLFLLSLKINATAKVFKFRNAPQWLLIAAPAMAPGKRFRAGDHVKRVYLLTPFELIKSALQIPSAQDHSCQTSISFWTGKCQRASTNMRSWCWGTCYSWKSFKTWPSNLDHSFQQLIRWISKGGKTIKEGGVGLVLISCGAKRIKNKIVPSPLPSPETDIIM